MDDRCAICWNKGEHVHHFVPKFLVELFSTDTNPDMFRLWLCRKHHEDITKEWEKIRFAAKRLVANPTDWIETKYGEDVWFFLGLMATGHEITHEEVDCKECNKPMESLWIKQLMANGVDKGKRHLTRYKVMLYWKRRGSSDEEIMEKVLEFNSRCTPPEPENIVKSHVKSTLRLL